MAGIFGHFFRTHSCRTADSWDISYSYMEYFLCTAIRWEKSYRNLIKLNQNQIVFTTFRLIWNQMDVRLVPNQSENDKYNLISVWFNMIPKIFLCAMDLPERVHLNKYKTKHKEKQLSPSHEIFSREILFFHIDKTVRKLIFIYWYIWTVK